MLEGLPPNNAAYVMRLACDEAIARAVSDIIIETFDAAEAAVAAFEEAPNTKDWKGGPWLVEAYFGAAPDEANLRALIGAVVGEDVAAQATFGRIDAKDWVASSLEGLKPVRAGRFIVHGSHSRDAGARQRHRHRDRRGAGLRHRPPRHDARLPPDAGRHRAPAPAARRFSTSARARAFSPSPPPNCSSAGFIPATSIPCRWRRRPRTRGAMASAPSSIRCRRTAPRMTRCARARPMISSSPIFWRGRFAASRRRSRS